MSSRAHKTDRMNTLIVEDDLAALEAYRKIAERLGHSVTTCTHSTQAKEAFNSAVYPLVILDLCLPDMDGIELCRWMRRHPNSRYAVILINTAHDRSNDIATVLDAGADDYILKPASYDMYRLRLTILSRLAQHREQRATIEEQLQESEERYRDLFENTSDLIQLTSPDGRLLYVNQAWLEALGYEKADLRDLSIFDVAHPDSVGQLRRIIEQTISGGDIKSTETVLNARDGRAIVVEGNISCYRRDGVPLRIRAILRDVTERRRAEQELERAYDALEQRVETRTKELQASNARLRAEAQERLTVENALRGSEQRLRQIIDLVPHMIFAKNNEGRFLLANKAVANAYDLSVQALIEKQHREIHRPLSEVEAMLDKDRRVIELNQPGRLESEHFTDRSGSVRLLQTTRIPFTFSGSEERAVLGISIDITEQIRARERDVNREQRLTILTQQIPAVIWTCDEEGMCTSYTGAALKEFGVDANHDSYVPLHRIFGDDDGDDKLLELHRRALRGESVHYETQWHGRSFACYLRPMHDAAGQTIGSIGIGLDITWRKLAEQEIQEQQTLLSNAQRVTGLAVISWDLQQDELYGSGALYNILGRDQHTGQLSHAGFIEAIHPDDQARVRSHLHAAQTGQSVPAITYRILRPDGEVRYVNARTDVICGDDEQVQRVVGVLVDETEHKRTEEELQQSEARFSGIVNSVYEAIISVDSEARIVIFNKAAERIFGYSSSEILGHKLEKLLPDAIRPLSAASNDSQPTAPSNGMMGIVTARRRDGSSFQAEASIARLKLGKSSFVTALLRDITQRREAEEELKSINRKLANMNKELRQFIDTANAPIFGIDRDGCVNEWNQMAENISGYEREEVLGRDLVSAFIAEEHRGDVRNVLLEALSGRETVNFEMPLTSKTGNRVIVLMNASSRRDAEGSIVGVLSVGQEITERIHAEQLLAEERVHLARRVEERTAELEAANEELARASRMKDEFLASMSHELRTPLNTILGMAESFGEEVFGELTERQSKAIRNIEDSGIHLLALINDILDLSKIGAGKLELEFVPVNVHSVCESSLLFVKQLALKKNISVNADYDQQQKIMLADELRIKQILVNLLANAVKFTSEGGSIGLRAEQAGGGSLISFTVWDTGIGIEPEKKEMLFQPFVQLDRKLERKYSGTGLGLSLVYRLTKLHGGEVNVESEPGKGSRFTVTLPLGGKILTDASGSALPSQTPSVIFGDTITPSPPSTPVAEEPAPESELMPLILIAEDNEINVQTFSAYLGSRHYRLCYARNGREAIDQARAERPDLILMDIQMPIMDGLEAIRRIRKDAELRSIPIFALTAFAMSGDKDRCLKAGADRYISKPVRLKELVQSIEETLA